MANDNKTGAEVSSFGASLKKAGKFASKYTTYITFIALLILLAIMTNGQALRWISIKNLIIAEAVRSFAALGVG
ncbi:MAG: hypothetical protein PHT39_06620, partial [Sphaerochaetaceae bacterium]|nr:hypothetical protein [Sphaerochaetaceae bacterium]